MAILDQQFRTITCDTCGKTVTFDPKNAQQTVADNPWLNSARVVQNLGDGRNFCYCSDECTVVGVGQGNHNPVEKKKIVEAPGGEQAIKMAALAAQAAEEATKAIKDGKSTKLQVVRS